MVQELDTEFLKKVLSFIWLIARIDVMCCLFCFCVCSYQLEALDRAIRENTIVYLETGSGKTLIAIMLLRSYAYYLRKPSPYISVFLVPKVVLVSQVCCHFYDSFCIFVMHCLMNKLCDDWKFTVLVFFVQLCILASCSLEKPH